ncbi:Zinc finger BED domain-containing protein 5 [Araneus ventricosus]|uniref:Zinc finger BED domain-containing protein 5 n=1 Tax=Araneus ventricosus TaxID=182803 RepID=A0A4Y2D3U0_ARAVE|nr:Zinc finger BED domain-containing protein 5 [Araneus ventricosus]GBM11390.1 Zinc finger BED domain-containing protein 5 [Araneus ventricosus]
MVILLYPYLNSFHEDLLLCKPLLFTSTGTEIFKLLDEFFVENSILWDNCVDVCTDWAKAMTGKAVTVFDATDKVEGFKKKLKYWVEYIKNGSLDCFPLTKRFGEELESDIPADILNEFDVHVLRLIHDLNSYFPKTLHENLKENVWVVEPNSISKNPSSLTSQEYECLLDLTSDTAITSEFKTEKSISDFWCTLKDEFKILSDKANLILLPFATTYSVETGLSAYTATKTKYR